MAWARRAARASRAPHSPPPRHVRSFRFNFKGRPRLRELANMSTHNPSEMQSQVRRGREGCAARPPSSPVRCATWVASPKRPPLRRVPDTILRALKAVDARPPLPHSAIRSIGCHSRWQEGVHKGPRALISRVPLQAATRRDLLFLHPSACGHTTPSGRPAIAAPDPRARCRCECARMWSIAQRQRPDAGPGLCERRYSSQFRFQSLTGGMARLALLARPLMN